MSSARACLQCRTAKVKCDLARPSCGRCVRRGVVCAGYPVEGEYVFRDETTTAQRLSERARRPAATRRTSATSFELDLRQNVQQQYAQGVLSEIDPDLRSQYSWLNEQAVSELPEPLKRDIETRAVERFFVDWTVYPSEASPGHMHHLPMLYENAQPSSLLRLAVRAVAFADMKHARDQNDVPFHIKSQRSYGAALTQMREITNNEQELTDDRVLAALLVIDYYESLYLARSDPLGRHSDAVRYVIHARGESQLHRQTCFCLWRIANFRLQARQILLGEEPNNDQKDLLSKLNLDRPDLHIFMDVLHATELCAAIRNLVANEESEAEKVEHASKIMQAIQTFFHTTDAWTTSVTGIWKPSSHDASSIVTPAAALEYPPDHPLKHFTCPQVLRYIDVHLACVWIFYSACQIALRESFIQLIMYMAELQRQDSYDHRERIEREQQSAIESLSGSILQSFPTLMGLAHDSLPPPSSQGKMVGRFLGLFAMIVIQRARFTSVQHKLTAGKVIDWISANHKLN